jgi:endoribonuclease Dicer
LLLLLLLFLFNPQTLFACFVRSIHPLVSALCSLLSFSLSLSTRYPWPVVLKRSLLSFQCYSFFSFPVYDFGFPFIFYIKLLFQCFCLFLVLYIYIYRNIDYSAMENEARVSGNLGGELTRASSAEDVRPSYWLDACEDIPCDLVDFDTCPVPDSADNVSNQDGLVSDFFGGIDHILESIKNGGGLPLPQLPDSNSTVNGGDGWFQVDPTEGSFPPSDGTHKEITEKKAVPVVEDNSSRENGVQKVENRGSEDGEERFSKRARIGNYKKERCYSSRVQYHPKDWERCLSRKRPRDWDENDRRDRDNVRRREHYSCNRRDGRDRDWRERDAKGYWERDRLGSGDMVFRLGAWEADRNKEAKAANDKNQESDVRAERKSEEPKEKIPQEHARQYQLDVLEQAKKKNTIAFLETGAGKTLIAVLLMKSVCNDLQRFNRKMLAVFLVPKVPLVYQVLYFGE